MSVPDKLSETFVSSVAAMDTVGKSKEPAIGEVCASLVEKLCKQRTHLNPATLQHLLTFAVRHAECVESIEDAQATAPRVEVAQSTAQAQFDR